ncbi:hypothetical protein E1B28_009371 [Marasmius oreades]|uniref:Uncharacterized protein n=1 Tax=Marasmius oreades TaxID=181124 RepID=A0A9P7S0V6_9AGAR|nr:uncharacterized protein E1B28_009371 [Marasmius oreades]KAG7093083.1 hypothetical protein E1B28_009371 [Marasmius oreades]
MQQSAAPRSVTTYVHYTGPSSATTRTTTTTTPTPVQQPTTVAPKDVTFKAIIHSPKPRPAPQPATTGHQASSSSSVTATATITAKPASTATTLSTNTTGAPSSSSVATTSIASAPVSVPSSAAPSASVVAQGDWTKDLVHLAKTAELKKHALTLQLHTAQILSSQALLEQKSKSIQDVKEQRNKLDSERNRLLESLRQVNEDRDKADILTSSIEKECTDLRNKISHLSEGDYALAKRHVDQLRKELGRSPLPSLQSMLDEKSVQYLTERRLNAPASSSTEVNANNKRPAPTTILSTPMSGPQGATFAVIGVDAPPAKRPRGRPKGSKNRKSSG